MQILKLVNVNADTDCFDILKKTATRVLSQRKTDVADIENAYTVTFTVDSTLQNDRFVIRTEGNGASIAAANGCSPTSKHW